MPNQGQPAAPGPPRPPANGTCGRMHGEMVGMLAAQGQTLLRLEEHTNRQWHAIGERIRWRMFSWIIGTLILLMTIAAGTFAVAQRADSEEAKAAIAECGRKASEADKRFEAIQGDLRAIAVHLEYLRANSEQAKHRQDREDRVNVP